jgi:hypothetical protein
MCYETAMRKLDPFLPTALDALARLQRESSVRGYEVLARLLELAREEAEDEIRAEAEESKAGDGSNVIPLN